MKKNFNKLLKTIALIGLIITTCGFSPSSNQSSLIDKSSTSSLFSNQSGITSVSQEPLPAFSAFKVQIQAETSSLLLTPADGYMFYVDTLKITGGEIVKIPPTTSHYDEITKTNREVIATSQSLLVKPLATHMTFEYQGCQDKGICYPPMKKELMAKSNGSQFLLTEKTSEVSNPTVTEKLAEDQEISHTLSEKPVWLALLTFLGLGIALGLTPCVLPMVPILTALVAGQDKNITKRKTLALASTYVLAHAFVFAGLGIAATLIGSGLNAFFQNPITLAFMAILLGGLGISMMQSKSIQMPLFIQNWAGRKGQGGSFKGVATMGALSSLIVGPCVAPPLAGAVLYLSTTGNWILGGAALFSLGLGMGIPMLIAATGMKHWIQKMNGSFSQWTTRILGTLLIVVAVSILARFWDAAWYWLPLLLVLAWPSSYKPSIYLKNGLRTTAFMLGLSTFIIPQFITKPNVETQQTILVSSEQELEKVLISSKKHQQTVVVDFYADWCSSCKNMESQTFSNSEVKQKMEHNNTTFVKIDITENEQEHQNLLKKYQLIGPPAILFFNEGKEVREKRLIGFENKDNFKERLDGIYLCSKAIEEKNEKTC